MTITSTTSEIAYAGDGVSTVFTIPFDFDTSADLKVIETTAGVPVVVTTGFSIAGGGGGTGTLTRSPALPVGTNLTILDNPELTQPVDYSDNDPFPAETHEKALDRVTRLCKRLNERVERSIRVADGDLIDGDNNLLPISSVRASKYLAFDATGKPTVGSGTGGGDAALRSDLASTAVAADGSRLVGFRRTETGSIARSVFAVLAGMVSVADFGTNTTPGTTDMTSAIQNAVNAGAALGVPAFLPASIGECKITSPIAISSSRSGLYSEGKGHGRILAAGCHGFTVAAGLSFITIDGLSIAQATRYTTTPNAFAGVKMNGTTASAVQYSHFDNLFIDGFETAVQADGLRDSSIVGLVTPPYGKNGIIASQLSTSVIVSDFDISCGAIAAGVGIRVGDGTAASEGWLIGNGVIFGVPVGIDGLAASFCHVTSVIIDQATQFGVLLRSATGGCSGWKLTNVDCFMTGGAADTGIYLTNGVAVAAGQDIGHTIFGCNVFQYPGTTLANGLLCDGTQEKNNRIMGCSLNGDTYDCRITQGTGHIVIGNNWLGAGYSATVKTVYQDNAGTVLSPDVRTGRTTRARTALTYSASMTADASLADTFTITPNNGTAFTINSATNPTVGQVIRYYLINTSGGALGAITWINHKLVGGSMTNPANGFRRLIDFEYDGTSWYEVGRASGDVPN